jgi:PEP-CTERM motif
MMLKRILLGAALSLVATPSLAASILYGADNVSVFTINTSTGGATLVGSTGLGGFDADGFGSILRDLTASSTTLYGAQWNVDANGITGAVATVNTATGAVTSSVALTGLLETGPNKGLYSIAYDIATNTLYGNTSRRVYKIDPTTGAATFVGNVTTGSIIGLGIENSTGNLYSITQVVDAQNAIITTLRTLSKVDASVLSSITLANQCGCDIAFDPLTNQGFISSNFFDANGALLYAGLDLLDAPRTSTTFVGQHGGGAPAGMPGLAFLGVAGAVPEPATWSMMIAGFGLAGFAVRRSRRVAALA